jgi:5-methylcytosine-specific restriction endonuclease McrA
MPLTLRDRVVVWQQVEAACQNHRRCARAAGRSVFYRVEDMGALVEQHLERGVCPYCRGPLPAGAFVLDLRVPAARGGRYTLRNLVVCCRDCHLLKGALDDHEYRELLAVVGNWPRPLQNHFRARLRAGASTVRTALPVCGSLEWFTGSAEAHEPSRRLPGDEAPPPPPEAGREMPGG